MNSFSKICSPSNLRALRAPLIALAFFLPAFVQAQEVLIHVNGQTGIIGVPVAYNGKYALQDTSWGFLWLDTEALLGGHVQAISRCNPQAPPSDSNYYVAGGDCNGITAAVTGGNVVVAYMTSGECAAQTLGCPGPRDDGHNLFKFGLGGGFPYLGEATEIPPASTQRTDLQGRTWSVRLADTTYTNFIFYVSGGGGATPTPSATPTPAPPTPTPTPGPATRATNLSGQSRGDGVNYYGDKWQLQDISNPSSTRTDWDFNYQAPFLSDLGGDTASEGTVRGYFPCDPQRQGVFDTGMNCMQSLGLTNPPAPGSYQFAMLSSGSPNPFISAAFPVVCPQAVIVGYTGFGGTCSKSGGVLSVPRVGGIADARGSKGNTTDAQTSFDWTFPGSGTPNVSGPAPAVPSDATTFTLTITFPGGYQATASGSVTLVDSNPALGIFTDPNARTLACCVLFGGGYQLTAGTTYYLKDTEPVPPASAQFFFNDGGGDVSIGSTPPVPLPWTPFSICSVGCSVKVTVGGLSSSKSVVISSGAPTPVPTPIATPTPPSGGTLSVYVTGQSSGPRNSALSFTANPSGGSGNYGYAWTCDYNPSFPSFSAGSQTRTCTYSTAGSYIVKAQVTDMNNGSTAISAAFPVTITGGLPAPVSTFTLTGVTFDPFSGYQASTGSPITFTASEIESNVASYTWSFGDGSSGSGRSVTHTYSSARTYTTSLTVAGNETTTSGTASSTKTLRITGLPAPSAAYTVAGATQTGANSYDAEAGALITFTATGTNISGYLWDFGEGPSATTNPATKKYATTGVRTVRLTVTGDGTNTGGSQSASISVNVIPAKFKAIIVPGAAHLDLGASVWGTDVTITNPGTDTLTITPNFYPYLDGAPDNVDLSQISYDPSLSFQLAPGASWSQVDVVKFLNGGSNKGTLIFKYEGTADPVVTARVYFASASDPLGASYGAAFPSFKITGSGGVSIQGAEEALATDQTIIGLRSNSAYRFVVTLFNASSTRATFRLNAFDEIGAGILIKEPTTGKLVFDRDFTVGPFQQIQVADDNLGLNDANKKYVLKASKVSNTGTLIAFGTALDRKTSDLVQIADDTPSTAAESGVISYYVAGVAHLDTSRAQWRTDLRIFNRGSNPRNLYFEYFFNGPDYVEHRAHVDSKRIGPGELLTWDDVVDSLLKPEDSSVDLSGDTAGILRIFYPQDSESATKPLIIGLRNYDDPSDGTGTAGTQLGVYSASQSTTVASPALVTPGAEESSRFYSQIGLFALDNVLTTGVIAAYDKAGHEVGHFDFALNQAGGVGHFGQIRLSGLADFNNPGTPVSVFVSVTSGGRLGSYVTMVDLKTNDLTFIQGRPLQ